MVLALFTRVGEWSAFYIKCVGRGQLWCLPERYRVQPTEASCFPSFQVSELGFRFFHTRREFRKSSI